MCRQASLVLPADPSTAAAARRFVGDHCTDWHLADLCEDLVLPVSELVTNAVLHARTDVTVTVTLSSGFIEVAVRDSNPRPPVLRPVHVDLDTTPADDDPRAHVIDAGAIAAGRGLRIVDAVADEWGVAELAGGKDVWFRLRCPAQWSPPEPCPCGQVVGAVSPGGMDVAVRG